MALNVISNFAANVAHRNLVRSDMEATNSLAKLSSGTRVVSAKDDAASMAIGSRLQAEVNALRMAAINANQAVSMLQIADGAMARVTDILIRMKTLSVQAGSGQLSNVERGMLDTEYQNLLSEVDRIAADTEFNGNQLVNGDQAVSDANTDYDVSAGVVSISARGFDLGTAGSDSGALAYDATAQTFTFTIDSVAYSGTINADAFTGTGTNAAMATGTQVVLTNTGSDASLSLTLNVSFDAGGTVASDAITIAETNTTSYSFKVGSGVTAADTISISMQGVSAHALGITATDITSTTNADMSSVALSNAIDNLNESRAALGASQNRLEFASSNLATAVENTEAARSSLLDLDVASEMSIFTSKQILVQAGVSMLAQANQMPQNLLRLFQ